MLARPVLHLAFVQWDFQIDTHIFLIDNGYWALGLPVVGGTLFRAGGTLLLGALTPGRATLLEFKIGQGAILRKSC